MIEVDVLVVGAGIAGASVAWRLARAGRRVLLLEREPQPGYHSTGRSAAMFMESYGPPQVRALTRASRAFYLDPPAQVCDAPLLHPRAALFVAAPEQAAALDVLYRELQPDNPQLRRLSADQALALVPVLRPERVMGGLLDDSGFDIDAHALLQGFLRGARAAGTVLRTDDQPVMAEYDGQSWRVGLASGAVVRAPTVVNAAGAWADELAARFGAAPVGLSPRRRSAFTFAPPPGVDIAAWPLVVDVDERWYFKPDAGQLLGSPANADPVPPHDVAPEELDIATGIHRIEEASTLQIRRPSATWAGLRSFVTDGEPVIGFDADCPGFFWLAAQGGYGIQSAAGASAVASALVQGLNLPDDLVRQGVDAAAVSPRRLRGAPAG